MHRKKVKLKKYRKHMKTPILTRSHATQSCVSSASAEMSPELNRTCHLGMKSLIAQCKLCGKKFINEPYLHAHHERRHYGRPYRPLMVDGSAALLEVEINYLKHRLTALECQLLKRDLQQTHKGNVKVTQASGDSEIEVKKKQTIKEHKIKVLETKAVDNKSEGTEKINKYEKEVEELKNMFFAQIKELKQASQQPVVYMNNESVQTDNTVYVPADNEKELKQASQQPVVYMNNESIQTDNTVDVPADNEKNLKEIIQRPPQPVPVKNESIQTDVVTEDIQEKEDGELQNKLEERESVWRLRLAKADEQHKQELKQIQDRLQHTYEEGNQIKRELEEKLKQTLMKLASIEEENAQLLQKQSRLEEELIIRDSRKISPSDSVDTDSDDQEKEILNKNKTLLVKTSTVEMGRNKNKLLETDVEKSYKKEPKVTTFEKDKEDESDFEISLPDGFKQKQNMFDKKTQSKPVVGNFCEITFENIKENKKNTKEHVKSPTNHDRNETDMDFLNETEENIIKTLVKKFNITSVTQDNSSKQKVISGFEEDSDDNHDDFDEKNEEVEAEDSQEKGMLDDISESDSSYSGSSESEEDSMVDNKPNQPVFENKQLPIQRSAEEKMVDVSSDDVQHLINELYLQILENMQQCLVVQPDMLNNVRQSVEEKLRQRLKQLAIDPDWTSLPQATFQSKMALLKHHQTITAKNKTGYFTQRGQLAKDVDLMMKRNNKDIGNHKVMQENILDRIKTKVAQVMKAYPKLASRANRVLQTSMETKQSPEVVKHPVHVVQQSNVKIVASSPKQQTPILVQDELLKKELEEIKMLQQSANKLKMYALDDDELSESDSLSWSLSSISKDMSPGKGTFFHVENKMKSAMKNAAASSGSITKKRVLFAEDAHAL